MFQASTRPDSHNRRAFRPPRWRRRLERPRRQCYRPPHPTFPPTSTLSPRGRSCPSMTTTLPFFPSYKGAHGDAVPHAGHLGNPHHGTRGIDRPHGRGRHLRRRHSRKLAWTLQLSTNRWHHFPETCARERISASAPTANLRSKPFTGNAAHLSPLTKVTCEARRRWRAPCARTASHWLLQCVRTPYGRNFLRPLFFVCSHLTTPKMAVVTRPTLHFLSG